MQSAIRVQNMEKAVENGKKYLRYLYPVILFLYPLRHIRVGAEWWDTGYNYGNFTYMDRMDPMWLLSTYLGNATGHLLTMLPGGDTMLGMNIYTGLFVSLLALGGYFFFTRRIGLSRTLAFWGEMLAVSFCWCPTALLYNYLTYVLMGAGVVLLYHALSGEARHAWRYFAGAGVCLGVNVLVRFPNLAQAALILAVWAMALIRRQAWKKTVKQTMQCLGGYLLGLGGGLAVIALRYGPRTYIEGIQRLLSMPSEASEYTAVSMVTQQLRNYLQNCIWLGYLVFFMLLGFIVYALLPQKLNPLKNIGYVACVFCGFYYLMLQNMFNFKYSTKASAFQWGAILLTATLAVGLVTILRKKSAEREKLMCGLGILVILITPLGSNNHLYSAINNLFFVAPFTLWMLIRFLRWIPGRLTWSRTGKGSSLFGTVNLFPVKAMMVCILVMITVQGTLFGIGYVFSESDGGENLHTPIEGSKVLGGMLTSPDRAEVLNSLLAYVNQEGLKGQEIILYGRIPALSYYLEMPFAISAWPDLPSYNYEVMVGDLERLAGEIASGQREIPVLLLEKKQGTYLTAGPEALEALGVSEWERTAIAADKKLMLLEEWIGDYGYGVCFENEKFVMFRVQRGKYGQ